MGRDISRNRTSDSTCTDELLTGDATYRIRPFIRDDLEDVRALYEAVHGAGPDPEWLEWKFLRNPAMGEECMFVADSPEGILGILPLYPVRLRFGTTPFDATCQVNVMVHPDYQGIGVFSALRNYTEDYLSERTDLMFGLANSKSRPIYRHWGSTEIGRVHAHFRIQNPEAIFPADGTWRSPLAYFFSVSTRTYLAIRDRLFSSPRNVSVSKAGTERAVRLAALYRRSVPEVLHVVRSVDYYRWRLGTPKWSGEVYIARNDNEDIAAFVTRSRSVGEEVTRIEVSDVLPLVADHKSTPGYAALLDRIIRDHQDADVISIQSSIVPARLLRECGFVSNAKPPFSWLFARVYVTLSLFVTSFTDTAFDVGDRENWLLSELTINTD